MQLRGICACDEEHMFNCPHNIDSNEQTKKVIIDNKLNDVIDSIFGGEDKVRCRVSPVVF